MNPRLLIIDNYDSFTYNVVQIIEEHGTCYYDVFKNDKVNIKAVARYDKIIFSPGPGVPSAVPVMNEIIGIYCKDKSILGICLGFQAIVEYFGGKLYNLPGVYHGIKQRIRIMDTADYLFAGLPEDIYVGLYHSWAAVPDNFPKALRVTSVSEDDIIMSVTHVNFDVKGVQFHPESFMTDSGRQIIHNWLDYCPIPVDSTKYL
jgi:anthranilate synthase component 2